MSSDMRPRQAPDLQSPPSASSKGLPKQSPDTPLQAMLDAVPSAILHLDPERRFVESNRRGQDLVGKHKSLDALLDHEPWMSASRLLDLVLATGVDDFMEARDPEDGSTWDIAVHQIDSSRPTSGVVLVLRDITIRSRLQTKLKQRDHMAALGDLVYGISHKVRSNLFGITGLIDVIRSHIGHDPEMAAYLDLQRQQSTHTVELLDQLVQYAGPQDHHRVPGPLGLILNSAIHEARESEDTPRHEFQLELASDLPEMLLDRDRVTTAFAHILRNALQNGSPDTAVRVRAQLMTDPNLHVMLFFDDDGPGISPKDLARVFEPFFSRRPRGRGMGLPIAQRIVRDHGGTIEVSNRAQGGCRVTVKLPVVPKSPMQGGDL